MRRRKGALWDVFISHSTKDNENGLAHRLLTRLIADLPSRAIRVWADREKLRVGDLWRKDIADAINKSHVGIILLDERALNRPWVYKEANLMEGQPRERHYRVITVLIGLTREQVCDHGNEVFTELVTNTQTYSVVEDQPHVDTFLAKLLDLLSSAALGLLPENQMRLVQRVAEHLPDDPDEIIDLATWFDDGPHPPPLVAREVLAHLMLKAGLEPCVRQMFVDAKDYFLGREQASLKRLVQLIAPSWIPLEAAAPIVPSSGSSNRVSVLGTIADAAARVAITCKTGKALVRRATHWDENTCDVREFSSQIPTGAERADELGTDMDQQLDYWARERDSTKYIVLEAGKQECDRLDGVRHVHRKWPGVVVVLVIGPDVDPEAERFDAELGTPTYYRTSLPRAGETRAGRVISEICRHLDINDQGESA